MADPIAYIKELNIGNNTEQIVYPVTRAAAVYMNDDSTTVQDAVADLITKTNYAGLTKVTTATSGNYIPIMVSNNNRAIDYNDLAKAIIENYNSSTIAGKAQSVKQALDTLNSSKAILTYGGTNIPSGSDLNTYTTPGTYFSNLPTAPSNVPTGFGGYFKLVVGTTTGVTDGNTRARVQTISKSGSSGVEEYTRVLRSTDSGSTWNVWVNWEKLPARSELDSLNSTVSNKLSFLYNTNVSTQSSSETLVIDMNSCNRHVGLLFILSNGGASSIYGVYFKKNTDHKQISKIFGETPSQIPTLDENGNIQITLMAWSRAVYFHSYA